MIDIDQIGAAVFIVALRDDGCFVYEKINATVARRTGLSPTETAGRTPMEIFSPSVAAMLTAHYRTCVDGRKDVDFERVAAGAHGLVATRTTLTPLLDGPDLPVRRILGVSVDTTEQHRLREDLKRSRARLAVAVDALGGVPWFFDVRDSAFEFGAGFDRILGVAVPASMPVDVWLEHVHPEDRDDTCFAEILAGRREQGTAEFRVITADGEVRWLRCRRRAVADDGVLTGIAGIIIDVTQEKRREDALSLQAASDALTGLANRRRFEEVLTEQRETPILRAGALSVLMIDVDHFKPYNDRYGHVAGDVVLQRLAACFRHEVEATGGIAARFGGEEFVAVLPKLDSAAATAVAERILADIRALAIPHAGSPLGRVSVSIGVASQSRAQRAVDLVALADAALYRAKSDGRNRLHVRLVATLRRVDEPASTAA